MSLILVVEDDPTIAAVLREALEGEGYAVTAAADGEALWRAALARPAAILFDVNMPGMDGLEALGALRREARTRAIPLVLMSARADLGELATAHGVEALAKPFDLDDLLARVAALAGDPAR